MAALRTIQPAPAVCMCLAASMCNLWSAHSRWYPMWQALAGNIWTHHANAWPEGAHPSASTLPPRDPPCGLAVDPSRGALGILIISNSPHNTIVVIVPGGGAGSCVPGPGAVHLQGQP